MLIGAVAAVSLFAADLAHADTDAYRPGSGDEFIVVDCLLPGQVRRLGGRVYQSRRRPVMATARECHMRGGEFVLDDRASIEGSIQAWLPSAMEGDVLAQNYVGELAERGPNGQPDYAMARLWYARAAEQGSNTARFNLARLYENGLGGEADPDKAAELYRLAHGFDAELAGLVAMVDPAEIDALRTEIAERDATIEAREEEIDRLQLRIGALESETASLETERDAAQREIASLRQQVTTERAALSAALAEADAASAASPEPFDALADARAELDQRRQALAVHEQRLAERETALAAEIEALETVGSANAAEITRLTAALATARSQLASLEAEAGSATAARDQATVELAALRTRLDAQLGELARREAALAERESALGAEADASAALAAERTALAAERERFAAELAAYDAKRAQLDQQMRTVAAREAELAEQARALAEARDALDSRTAEIEAIGEARATLVAERQAFEAERAGILAAEADYQSRLEELSNRERQFARRMADLEKRAAAVTLREAEIEKREREAATAQASAEDALAQLETLKAQIQLAQETLSGGQRSLVPGTKAITPQPIRDAFEVEFGTYHALLIGNANYENPDWPDLDTSINDVTAIGRILEEKYGFRTTVLKDATRFEILKSLSDIGDTLTENDNLLIYFAGHGQYIDQVSSGYWEPVDSIPYKTVNSISVQDVNTQLSLTRARKVLVVSDSCYSGAFTRAPFAMLNNQGGHDAREKYLQQIAEKRSRNVMTAGGLQPVADGLGNGHSLFARAFISALVDNDDVALGRDVFSRVRDVVTVSATAMNWEQEPEYDEIVHSGHEGGDFIFVPVAP